MPLPLPSYYVRAEAKRARAADKLVTQHKGDHLEAADDAWHRMEDAIKGTDANFWGAVCLIIQKREAND